MIVNRCHLQIHSPRPVSSHAGHAARHTRLHGARHEVRHEAVPQGEQAHVSSAFAFAQCIWKAVSFVLFPRGCAGCDAPDEVLCRHCTEEFRQHSVRPVSAPVRSGEVWACAWYRGSARQAVLRWKDHGDEEADAPLCALLRELVQHRATPLRRLVARSGNAACDGRAGDARMWNGCAENGRGKDRHAENGRADDVPMGNKRAENRHTDMNGSRRFPPILVVPVPSSAESKRARGRFQTSTLARAVAAQLCACVGEAVYADVLDLHGVSSKSVVSSSRGDRAARIRGRVRVKRGTDLHAPIVLVDDIVTSGATIRECAAVLHRHGADIIAVFTLAAVPFRATGGGS